MKSICGCDDDSLCQQAKKLWKLRRLKGRKQYSDHRRFALGLGQFDTVRANNVTTDGKPLKYS